MARSRVIATAVLLWAGMVVAVAAPAAARTPSIVPNGPAVTATITGPSDLASFAFAGTGGDTVNLTASNGTFAGGCDVLMQIADSHGRILVGPACAGSSAFFGSVGLPGTGTYLAQVVPGNGNAGSVTLRLSRNAAASTIAENGPPVTFTATKPGQGRDFAFTGTVDDVVNLTAAGGTYPGGCDVLMQILDTHGRGIVGPVCAGTSAFLGSIILPGTATYLVRIIPGDGNTGSVTLKLSENAADSTIAENGPPVTFTATKPGQGRNYAFTGTAGDVVNLTAGGGTYPGGCDVLMQIVDSHDRGIAGPACAGNSSFLGSIVLPGTGGYLVKVLPGNGNTGSVTLTLSRNAPDSTIAVGGSVTFTATKPGQGRNYAFTAVDGESLDLTASGTYAGNCDVVVAISDSYGRILRGPACGGDTGSLTATVVPGTGTYLVKVIPTGGVTGSVTVHLADTP